MFSRIRPFFQRSAKKARCAQAQRVLIVRDEQDIHAMSVSQNALNAFSYAGLEVETVGAEAAHAIAKLDHWTSICLCVEALDRLPPNFAQKLEAYVRAGGGVAVFYRGWAPTYQTLFGMAGSGGWPKFRLEDPGGLEFITDHFAGLHGVKLTREHAQGHVPYDLTPGKETLVLAENCAGDPIAWLHRIGAGKLLYWNTAILGEKSMRGLLVQSVALVQQQTVLSAVGSAVIQIDDFPPPPMDAVPVPLAAEFPGLSPEQFFTDVWFADMQEIAERSGVVYSSYCVLDYASHLPDQSRLAAVPPQFDHVLARDLAQSGELGLHGYDHNPLFRRDPNDPGQAEAELRAARHHWTETFGLPAPRSYVAPDNMIDAVGMQAIRAAFPDIDTVCTLYARGDFEEGGDREFGPDPWQPDLYALPRATCGYEMDAEMRFWAWSQINTMGAWTHFVHPDDVFDCPEEYPDVPFPRNPDGHPWRGNTGRASKGLRDRFADWMAYVDDQFPWLEYMTTSALIDRMKAYRAHRPLVEFDGGKIIMHAEGPRLFHIRLDLSRTINPLGIQNAQLVHVRRGSDYAVHTLRLQRSPAIVETI